MATGAPAGGGFSLFPKERSPSRNRMHSTSGPRPSIDSMSQDAPARAGRRTPLERRTSNRDGQKAAATMVASTDFAVDTAAANTSQSSVPPAEPIVQRPAAVFDPTPRGRAAVSGAQTLVRRSSSISRSSIAKLPLSPNPDEPGQAVAPMRSIFPQYNPALPLAQQDYYPTQRSPPRIPPDAISRRLYSPTSDSHPASPRNGHVQQPHSPPLRSPRSDGGAASTVATGTRKWPPARTNEPAHPSTPPEISSTEQLREYWKVANGWRAAASEGRVYTFRVSCERDAPVYTLASKSQQPFYRLKLDPTSTSAYVSMARFDPAKVYKPPVPPKDGTGGSSDSINVSGSKETAAKGWQEVISTTLEASERRHAPSDGLVAMLFPSVAAKVAVNTQYTNAAASATAERECARLVWDDDSGTNFLVHPALAMPFCVTVERNPTWSRTEYTLEHIESPQHLARLTKDGTGTGWLEIDSGIASKIDSVYLVDVAVAALVLVAHADGEFHRVEVFEPPPSIEGSRNSRQDRSPSRLRRLSSRIGTGEKKKIGKSKMQEFEIDLESQTSDLKKHLSKEKSGTHGCARMILSLLRALFKCFIWCATIAFKALTGCIGLFTKCITSEKL